MRYQLNAFPLKALLLALVAVVLCAGNSSAYMYGVTGTTFNLTAKHSHITLGDGASLPMWGFALNNGTMQYPGPTMIVPQGETVTVTLTNRLPMPVSILFPGHQVTVSAADPGAPGRLTGEAPPGGTVTYQFVASNPGTFMYYSGSHPDFQLEMGLLGALIVRPTGFVETDPATYTAYGDPGSAYDYEYLFLHTELDPLAHNQFEFDKVEQVDTTEFFPVYWALNGRTLPDTLAPAGAAWLPTQPYDATARTHPGARVLIRTIGGGRDAHPFHTHGNNFTVIAKDGRRLLNGALEEIGWSDFTQAVAPGKTIDGIYVWTGAGMGWDIFGHAAAPAVVTYEDMAGTAGAAALGWPVGAVEVCQLANQDAGGFDIYTREYCADHGKPFPVRLPDQLDLTFGQFYSGSPYLGAMGALPPGEGGFNAFGGFFFMWHSHNEKELTNNDIFPGGQAAMMVVEHPSVFIPHYQGEAAP
jgi:hypothetical protein